MAEKNHGRLPQSTIAKLFLVTSAVAIGVAVSQEPVVEATATWGMSYDGDTPGTPSLYSVGVVLLVSELIRQAIHVTLLASALGWAPGCCNRSGWRLLNWAIVAACEKEVFLQIRRVSSQCLGRLCD